MSDEEWSLVAPYLCLLREDAGQREHSVRDVFDGLRWAVERSFAWTSRARRLARDYERLPEMLAGLHVVAFVMLMLRQATNLLTVHYSL